MASIKDIARAAGTSVATVSRVLNQPDYRCADPGMADRIWKCAADLNYVPNAAAKRLKKGETEEKTRNYQIQILQTRSDGNYVDPFFSELLHVIRSELHRRQCILSRVWFDSFFSEDGSGSMLQSNKIIREMHEAPQEEKDGLIILGKCNPRVLETLKKEYKNIVSVNRNSTNYAVDEVLCDGKKIAALATEYLISLGHREIAYVGPCRNDARYKGFTYTLASQDIDLIADYVQDIHQSEKNGYRVMEYYLQQEKRPTAFYCANDITAVGMIKCLNYYRNRTYFPSIVSSDNIEESQFTNPMLTTVNLPKEQMGKFAVYLLLDRISGGHNNIVRMEMEGNLVRRSSCARVEESYITEYYI
ncbi:MAG: LacI family DNA-binding transcriptional regulator [Lachnospiraceae bacterium]|nr:LacI family DNA-binding transcriptional regulator [Lachnospiraceae bacterium]